MKTRFSSTEPAAPPGYVNGVFSEVLESGVRKVAVHVPAAGASPPGGGASAFTDLTDVPASYVGEANKVVSVKATEDGLEFTTPSAGGATRAIGIVLDGNGAVLTTGKKGYIQIPYNCTIVSWTILSIDAAPTSGSIVFDIWKDVFASYPPTVADTITAAAKPTMTTSTSATSSTLTGWTTAVTAGDVLGFNVDSVTSLIKVILQLKVTT